MCVFSQTTLHGYSRGALPRAAALKRSSLRGTARTTAAYRLAPKMPANSGTRVAART